MFASVEYFSLLRNVNLGDVSVHLDECIIRSHALVILHKQDTNHIIWN